jgi:hypothetical protein
MVICLAATRRSFGCLRRRIRSRQRRECEKGVFWLHVGFLSQLVSSNEATRYILAETWLRQKTAHLRYVIVGVVDSRRDSREWASLTAVVTAASDMAPLHLTRFGRIKLLTGPVLNFFMRAGKLGDKLQHRLKWLELVSGRNLLRKSSNS